MALDQKSRTGSQSRKRRSARPESEMDERLRIERLQAARRRAKRKRQRIRNVLVGLICLAVFGVAALFIVPKITNGAFDKTVMRYSSENEFTSALTSGSSQKAQTFAAKLCVVEGDTPLDGVTLNSGQEGLLLNASEYKTLFAQGAFNKVYPASITKIMTAIMAFKFGNMDDLVTITAEDVSLEEGAQVVGFYEGDQVTMDELMHALLVYSANDAAQAIAGHIGGSIDQFVVMMNDYAAELGCTGTHFANPSGLQDEEHYTTPYDIYLMLNEALNYPEFTELTQLSSYTVNWTRYDGSSVSVALDATDHYLTGEASEPKNVTVLGGKTGYTQSAGNCLAILSQNAYGQPFVSIVMGAETKDLLYEQMNMLLENINTQASSDTQETE